MAWCLYVPKTTAPVIVGGTNVSQEEVARRDTKEEIKEARSVYGLLMEAIKTLPWSNFARSRQCHRVVVARHYETPTRRESSLLDTG